MEEDFSYRSLGGLVNIVTLSPSKEFYYRIRRPRLINKANYGCCIAFYDIQGNLVYHHRRARAHWLAPFDQVHFVKWSQKGRFALFHEYARGLLDDYVFLDLYRQQLYRLNRYRFAPELDFLDELQDRDYDGFRALDKIRTLGVQASPVIRDPVPKRSWWDWLLRRNRWHPPS